MTISEGKPSKPFYKGSTDKHVPTVEDIGMDHPSLLGLETATTSTTPTTFPEDPPMRSTHFGRLVVE